jgi:hypothetical protein
MSYNSAQIKAVLTGLILRIIEMAAILGNILTAPKLTKTGRD